jgi:hypothetical protein
VALIVTGKKGKITESQCRTRGSDFAHEFNLDIMSLVSPTGNGRSLTIRWLGLIRKHSDYNSSTRVVEGHTSSCVGVSNRVSGVILRSVSTFSDKRIFHRGLRIHGNINRGHQQATHTIVQPHRTHAGARFTTLFCALDEVSLDSVTTLCPNGDQERESQTWPLPGSPNGALLENLPTHLSGADGPAEGEGYAECSSSTFGVSTLHS